MPRPYSGQPDARAKRGAILAVALIAGVFAALHPFANVTDPAIETLDTVICPFYLFAPVFADIPGLRDGPFFITAITVNALLYAAVAWKVTAIWIARSR